MSMYTSSIQKSTGNCGCGTGTHSNPCGCTTASADCGCNEGGLVRPNFFAGQLLTDEDLQTLNNYFVTKQRLHNRFLIGSGVSCGLAVTCHPCGGGKVMVQSGYAVDCCGNEILVPCPVELDINGMVRDLKFSRLGHDCGDPCPEPLGQESATGDQHSRLGTDNHIARDDNKKNARRYCLYINYCEKPSDPIAPYTQDDSCAVSCQPSRIREGFSLELRCPSEEPEPPSILDRIRCCIGDLFEADKKAETFNSIPERVQNNEDVSSDLAEFKSWLLRKIDECPPIGECSLMQEIEAIVIPVTTDDGTKEALTRAVDQIARAFLRYLIDCICSALLPPCPSCEDPAVKLACLDVIDCEIDNICNLERTFLLTEHNLRYWIPLLHEFGEALEKACCSFASCPKEPAKQQQTDIQREFRLNNASRANMSGDFAGNQPADAKATIYGLFSNLVQVAGLSMQTVTSAINFSGNVARITLRDPIIDSMLARMDLRRFGKDFADNTISSMFELPAVQEELEQAVEHKSARIEEIVQQELANSNQLAEKARKQITKQVNEQVHALEIDIDKRVTSKGLTQTKVIRDLHDQLNKQAAASEALGRRLAKLEKGVKS